MYPNHRHQSNGPHEPSWQSHRPSQQEHVLPRPGMATPTHAEPPRPLEPSNVQPAPRLHISAGSFDRDRGGQRQQLPGLHELLSPATRPDTQPPTARAWPPAPPSSSPWERPPNSNMPPPHSHPPHLPQPTVPMHSYPAQGPPPRRDEMHRVDGYRLPPANPSGVPTPGGPPSLPLHQRPEPRLDEQYMAPRPLTANSYPVAMPPMPQDPSALDRRQSISRHRTSTGAAANSLQCVGQRDIPGEGLCYVYQDGSTCPTMIDGEPVNPLWGTTKAGKARKRLAVACLYVRS